MRIAFALIALILTGTSSWMAAEGSKTYRGVITDSMCTADHRPMKLKSDAKCVKD